MGRRIQPEKGEKGNLLDDWYNRKSVSMIAEHAGHEAIYLPGYTKTLCRELKKLIPLYNFLWSIAGDAP